ncbi:MAG: fibrobacter succinogenes major paralogous domain-containing protein [Dysgonamonadaceae bacterium]|jgi:uncharacterized protein (TIGR02145 family)|nr:fibrobacter succinogenes major paralogous domain-containing protein [Dysgonamonadaceae bacterium]
MKRKIYLMLSLLLSGIVITNAQVRIGGAVPPHPAALLDLNADDSDVGNEHGALALPRVALNSNAMKLNETTPKNGMLIYNTGTVLPMGVYVWINGKWIWVGHENVAPVITVQPRAFNWKETPGAGNLEGVGGQQDKLSITATGSNLTYQWYEISEGVSAEPVVVGTSSSNYVPDLSQVGMRSYYCVVSNSTGSVRSEVARVAVGCGALTANGSWRKFLCYNLGADNIPIAAQLAYPHNRHGGGAVGNDASDKTVYGDLYQWHRRKDGHEWPTSETATGPYKQENSVWQQVPEGNSLYGKFITGGDSWYSPEESLPWQDRYGSHDPCSDQVDYDTYWRIPSQADWADIYDSGDAGGVPQSATANKWEWRYFETVLEPFGKSGGYLVKPDGVTTTLFLPGGGTRPPDGDHFSFMGEQGYYWSYTAYGKYARYFEINYNNITASSFHPRSYGMSIRCIGE